jgi:serine/threonine-protein kinase
MYRMVAVKILSPSNSSNADFRDRFEREARAVARLNHPNIVMGIDAGHADGVYYFAMEFVDGETLGQYLRRRGGKLSEKEALTYIRQIALALKHAHENNLLHRDVKPDNILIDRQRGEAKLADLGLARDREANSSGGATAPGAAVGTPFYMSPEQARGKALSPATDFYALGGTLFHLLTGRIPFTGATAAVIMARHITDAVPNPRSLEPTISTATSNLIVKCLQKDPKQRYQTADDLLRDLDRALKGESASPSPTPLPKERTAVREAGVPARAAGEAEAEAKPARKVRVRRRRSGGGSISPLILIVVGLAAAFLLYLWLHKPTKNTPLNRPPVQQGQ